MPLTDHAVAAGVPRDMLSKRSPEFAVRTLQHIHHLSLAAKYSLRDLEAALDEARAARIHEIWPERRYQSVEELIEQELGESVASMQARKRSQAAAIATKVEDVLPVGRPEQLAKLSNFPRAERAADQGISPAQQKKLDKLARQAPGLLEEIRAGRMSVNAAFIEAGFAEPKTTIPTGLFALARWIKSHYDKDQIEDLITALRED